MSIRIDLILFYLINSVVITHSYTQNRALFFAINEYEYLDTLKYSIVKTRAIANTLASKFQFRTEMIENPTQEIIENKLIEYQNIYSSQSDIDTRQLLIYFSGHGQMKYNNGFFMAKDSKAINAHKSALPYEYWREFINEIECKHILVIIDACYGGYFVPTIMMKSGGDNDEKWKRPGETREEILLAKHKQYKARYVLTSSTTDQTPDNSKFANEIHNYLLKQYNNPEDSLFTLTELYNAVKIIHTNSFLSEFGDGELDAIFLFFDNLQSNSDYTTFAENEKRIGAFEKATEINTPESLREFIKKYDYGDTYLAAKEQFDYLDDKFWGQVKKEDSAQSIVEYINRFPDGKYLVQAENKRIEIEDRNNWRETKIINRRWKYKKFLNVGKSNIYLMMAEQAIDSIDSKEWNNVQELDNLEAFKNFLNEGPGRKYKRLAQKAIEEIEKDNTFFQNAVGNVEKLKEYKIKFPFGRHKIEVDQYLLENEEIPSFNDKEIISQKELKIPSEKLNDGNTWNTRNLNTLTKNGDTFCYNDRKINCDIYGKLYSWEAAKEACKNQGNGWRLPTKKEFENLAYVNASILGNERSFYDDSRSAQTFLNLKNGLFNGTLGGGRITGVDYDKNQIGYYWTSTIESRKAYVFVLNSKSKKVYTEVQSINNGLSIRCISGISN